MSGSGNGGQRQKRTRCQPEIIIEFEAMITDLLKEVCHVFNKNKSKCWISNDQSIFVESRGYPIRAT